MCPVCLQLPLSSHRNHRIRTPATACGIRPLAAPPTHFLPLSLPSPLHLSSTDLPAAPQGTTHPSWPTPLHSPCPRPCVRATGSFPVLRSLLKQRLLGKAFQSIWQSLFPLPSPCFIFLCGTPLSHSRSCCPPASRWSVGSGRQGPLAQALCLIRALSTAGSPSII